MTTDGWHPVSEHRVSWARVFARYQLQFILAGVFLAIVGILVALDIVDDEGALFWAGVIVIFYVLPWLVVSLVAGLRGIKQVGIFDEGVTWTVRRRAEIHAWDDVREVFRSEALLQLGNVEARITIIFKRKEQVVFDQTLSGFFGLATSVEAMTTTRLLPAFRQALDEGGAHFGPIMLKRQGIRINDLDFSWDEVEECTVHGGGLVITPRTYEDFTGEFADFRAVPNCLVMLRLLEQLGKAPVPAEQSIFLTGRKA